MASTITHAVAGYAVGKLFAKNTDSKQLPLLLAFIAITPDIDVITYAFSGMGSDPIFGHRGWTHSILFALFITPFLAMFFKQCKELAYTTHQRLSMLLFASLGSHIFLDMATDGTRGVSLFAPIDSSIYLLPQPLIVEAPIVYDFFGTTQTISALASEIQVIWLPLASLITLVRQFELLKTVLSYYFYRGRKSEAIIAGSGIST